MADAEFISREKALEVFQQQSGLGEALKELPDNPLPGVVLVTPAASGWRSWTTAARLPA